MISYEKSLDKVFDTITKVRECIVMNENVKNESESERVWWKAPESGEEYHTAYVWSLIAKLAERYGDTARATEAREAANREANDK